MTSALSQTGVSVEVIVADDASTDDTGQIVIGFRDERVRYLRLPVNGGPAAARNAAIDVAQGRWIAVLDADDLLLPDRLAKLVAVAVDRRLEIATDNMLIEDAQGHRRLFIQEALDGSIHTMSLANYVTNNRLFTDQPGEGYLKPILLPISSATTNYGTTPAPESGGLPACGRSDGTGRALWPGQHRGVHLYHQRRVNLPPADPGPTPMPWWRPIAASSPATGPG